MLIRVIDFETTGIPSEADRHAICEAGWCDVIGDENRWDETAPQSILVNPGRPIPIEAMAVHHIRDCDLVGAPTPDTAFAGLMLGADVFCAHNAKFEREFFAGGSVPWVCTYKCGLRAWPNAPGHSNQVLRYFLGVAIGEAFAMPPHRAGPDAYVTAFILIRLLAERSIEDLIKWSGEPAVLAKVGFGKHRGQKWSDVPRDYLEWILRQRDMDADVVHTAKQQLKEPT